MVHSQIRSLLAESLDQADFRIVAEVPLPVVPFELWPVALHPSGDYVALATRSRPIRIDVGAPALPAEEIRNGGPSCKIAFSPDGQWLAVVRGGEMCRLELWDGAVSRLVAQAQQRDVQKIKSMAFDSSGKVLWLCDRSGKRRGFSVPELIPPRFPLAVSANRLWSIDCRQNGRIGAGRVNIIDAGNERLWVSLGNRDRSDPAPHSIQFSPDSRFVAWGSRSGEVTLIDLPSLKHTVDEFEETGQLRHD